MRHAVYLHVHGNQHPRLANGAQVIIAYTYLIGTVIGNVLKEIKQREQTQCILAVAFKTLYHISMNLFPYCHCYPFFSSWREIN